MLILPYRIWNFILFQSGWFICVISVANNRLETACIALSIIIGFHLFIVRFNRSELLFILGAGIVGFIIDSGNIHFGVFALGQTQHSIGMAPFWLVGLWILFASTLNHSLRWIHGKYLLIVFLGALFGPIAYFAGISFGALTFSTYHPIPALVIISVEWAIILPLMFWGQSRLDWNIYHR